MHTRTDLGAGRFPRRHGAQSRSCGCGGGGRAGRAPAQRGCPRGRHAAGARQGSRLMVEDGCRHHFHTLPPVSPLPPVHRLLPEPPCRQRPNPPPPTHPRGALGRQTLQLCHSAHAQLGTPAGRHHATGAGRGDALHLGRHNVSPKALLSSGAEGRGSGDERHLHRGNPVNAGGAVRGRAAVKQLLVAPR